MWRMTTAVTGTATVSHIVPASSASSTVPMCIYNNANATLSRRLTNVVFNGERKKYNNNSNNNNNIWNCDRRTLHTSPARKSIHGCLSLSPTRFNGIMIHAALDVSEETFSNELNEGLKKWKSQGKKGIWLRLLPSQSHLIPYAIKAGFFFHHARPDSIMLNIWLAPGLNKLPHYNTHQIGVGGYVINEKREVLVIKEKDTTFDQKWKVPGGLSEPGEELGETAVREVFEETGIKSEFQSVIAFRHQHGVGPGYYRSDMYFVCRLLAQSKDIKMCTDELSDCRWMPLSEFAAYDGYPMNKQVSRIINEACPERGEDIYDRTKRWACDVSELSLKAITPNPIPPITHTNHPASQHQKDKNSSPAIGTQFSTDTASNATSTSSPSTSSYEFPVFPEVPQPFQKKETRLYAAGLPPTDPRRSPL